MRNVFGVLIVVFFIASCNNKDDVLIGKDDFVNLLIDLHIYDAVNTDHGLKVQTNKIDSTTLYNSIFHKYGVDRERFDATMRWYTRHPEDLADVYDQVFGELNKRNEAIKGDLKLFNFNVSKEIWRLRKSVQIFGDSALYPEPYIIEINDTGTYLVDVRGRMLSNDMSENAFLNIYFIKHKSDSLPDERLVMANNPITKSNNMRTYQYIYKLEDDQYKYMKIVYPDTPDRNSYKRKNFQISKIKVYRKKDEIKPNQSESSKSK